MADKRLERHTTDDDDRKVVEYHFAIRIDVIAHFDEARLKQLVDAEVAKLLAAVKNHQ